MKAQAGSVRVAEKAKPKAGSRASETRRATSPSKSSAKGAAKAKSAAKANVPSQAQKRKNAAVAGSKPRTAATRRKAPASMASQEQATGGSASKLIDQRIRDLGGWRGETLARMRELILEADPEIIEEWKWRGTPVWSRHGMVCTGEAYTQVVKLTFARGASVPDPSGLFNSSLEGNTRRAIDIREGEKVAAGPFKALIKAAVALNGSAKKKR